MYVGIAGNVLPDGSGIELGLSIHDSYYSVDFSIKELKFTETPEHSIQIENHLIRQLIDFSTEHLVKFVGAGVTEKLVGLAPKLCGRMWKELDIVPIVLDVRDTQKALKSATGQTKPATIRPADEQADSAVRKATVFFGPQHNPRLVIGFRNEVEVDSSGQARIVDDLDEFRRSVRPPTWNAVNKYADYLRQNNVKIGFFSSTPQGGGVALMRHALVRLLKLLGVNAAWYVPKPSPSVFRTTKNNHNILQGVADPNLRLTKEKADEFTNWLTTNAERYWISEGGPLAPGGVDVAFIDDPQMPTLIPIIKKLRPDLPVIYRSHIEIRSDLVHVKGSPQAEVWEYLWDRIKHADLFISHPVNKFVPSDVPLETLGLLPAATDWLDGLSKTMREHDLQYYFGQFRSLCSDIKMNKLFWPAREYVIQVARFDPAKGIPDVIASFAKLRKKLDRHTPANKTPQLLLCGHGAIDDPDASIIYDQTMELLESEEYSDIANDVVVMRIPPSDQILNTLLSCAKVVLQLSSREGFEVKVSEAIHKGKPIIATRAGGIPLQVQHGKNGFLVDVHDSTAVAKHLYDLWTDDELYQRMHEYTRISVSDEVSTLGNAASWLYLAAKFSAGEKLKPNGRWINDMMREDAGEPYLEGEPRLPRTDINIQG